MKKSFSFNDLSAFARKANTTIRPVSRTSIVEKGKKKLYEQSYYERTKDERFILSLGYVFLAVLSIVSAGVGWFCFVAPDSFGTWVLVLMGIACLGFIEYFAYKRSDEYWDKFHYLKNRFSKVVVSWLLLVTISIVSSSYGAYVTNTKWHAPDPYYMGIKEQIAGYEAEYQKLDGQIKGYEEDAGNYVKHGRDKGKMDWELQHLTVTPLRKMRNEVNAKVLELKAQLPGNQTSLTPDYARKVEKDSWVFAGLFVFVVLLMQAFRNRISYIDYRVTVEALPTEYVNLVIRESKLSEEEIVALKLKHGIGQPEAKPFSLNHNKEMAFQ